MKDLQEDNLFDSVRDRLGRYEEAPSDELWDKIASQKKKEKIWPLFLEPMGVIAIGVALLLNWNEEKIGNLKFEIGSPVVENKDVSQSKIVEEERISHMKPVEGKAIDRPTIIHQNEISIATESPISNFKPPISKDSTAAESPIIIKDDSSSAPQEIIPPFKKPKSKFQLYLSITPSLSFQKMSPSANDQLIIEGFATRSPLSIKRFGFAIDAGFQRDINRFFGYYGGVSFYQQHQELTYRYYNTEAEVTRVGDSFTYVINREQHTKTFNYSMTNIGASAGMLVTLKGEKLKHKFGAGLIYTRSLNSSNSYLAYKLSYRNEVKVNDYVSWFVEPNFTYAFISQEKIDEPFTLKPYRAGISFGVLYRFKK